MSQKLTPGHDRGPAPGPRERRLRQTIHRRRQRARRDDPCPYDDWGWWMEQRLGRLERHIKWLIGLAAGALAAEAIRIALQTFGLTP